MTMDTSRIQNQFWADLASPMCERIRCQTYKVEGFVYDRLIPITAQGTPKEILREYLLKQDCR